MQLMVNTLNKAQQGPDASSGEETAGEDGETSAMVRTIIVNVYFLIV